MDQERYVWFEHARVVGEIFSLMVEVQGHSVPLPVVLLHPDCGLRGLGDIGRLGVPEIWAREHGLCE